MHGYWILILNVLNINCFNINFIQIVIQCQLSFPVWEEQRKNKLYHYKRLTPQEVLEILENVLLLIEEVKTHRPKFRVGLNPTVHFLYSGFRPRGHYLEAVGLNPEDWKIVFWVQTQLPCGFEPNGSFFMFWVQTQRSLFRSSGFEPRGLKI